MTVARLEQEMSSAELTEWMGFWALRNKERKDRENAGGGMPPPRPPKIRR